MLQDWVISDIGLFAGSIEAMCTIKSCTCHLPFNLDKKFRPSVVPCRVSGSSDAGFTDAVFSGWASCDAGEGHGDAGRQDGSGISIVAAAWVLCEQSMMLQSWGRGVITVHLWMMKRRLYDAVG